MKITNVSAVSYNSKQKQPVFGQSFNSVKFENIAGMYSRAGAEKKAIMIIGDVRVKAGDRFYFFSKEGNLKDAEFLGAQEYPITEEGPMTNAIYYKLAGNDQKEELRSYEKGLTQIFSKEGLANLKNQIIEMLKK